MKWYFNSASSLFSVSPFSHLLSKICIGHTAHTQKNCSQNYHQACLQILLTISGNKIHPPSTNITKKEGKIITGISNIKTNKISSLPINLQSPASNHHLALLHTHTDTTTLPLPMTVSWSGSKRETVYAWCVHVCICDFWHLTRCSMTRNLLYSYVNLLCCWRLENRDASKSLLFSSSFLSICLIQIHMISSKSFICLVT